MGAGGSSLRSANPTGRYSVRRSRDTTASAARESLAKEKLSLADFAHLISPVSGELLETMGRRSHALTQQRFGKVIRLFAPLYLSNECINNCKYCGFSRDNSILRVTLSVDEVRREAQALQRQARVGGRFGQDFSDGGIGMGGLFAAAKDHGVACLDA